MKEAGKTSAKVRSVSHPVQDVESDEGGRKTPAKVSSVRHPVQDVESDEGRREDLSRGQPCKPPSRGC